MDGKSEKTLMCSRCLLVENKPEIWLDEGGVCNVCRAYEKASCDVQADRPLLETDFVRMLNQYRGKGEYDCLVMCSGGKDSTAALYYMVKRYKMKVLAFTFDHGFETEDAMENVRKAVSALGVDFLYFRSEYMKELFAEIVQRDSAAVICHPCSIWYMDLAFGVAAKYGIPVMIGGWTKGQSTRQSMMSKCGCSVHEPEFLRMSKATLEFLSDFKANHPRFKDFPLSMEEVLVRANKRHKCKVLSPHWFLPATAEEYVEILKKELGWEYPRLSFPLKTTNCYLNFLSSQRSLRFYGYTHYHVEMSKMIRAGLLSRQEALELLDYDFTNSPIIPDVLKKLGCGDPATGA